METKELEDIRALVTIFLPFAEELLMKYGEFYPYAGATTKGGEFVSVGQLDRNDNMDSIKVIADLKTALQAASDQYLVVALFYDVRTKDTATNETVDAIAIFIEHASGNQAYEFFYPYKIQGPDDIQIAESYGNTIQKEIFQAKTP